MPSFRTLYVSDTLRAVLNPGDAKDPACMITFESRGIVGHQDERFFAAPLASPTKPIVHVIPKRDTWYQEPDLPDLITAVRPFLSSDAFAYGSSMGGYAVARFADQMGVSRAIALSPQFSLDRKHTPFEKRWSGQAASTRFLYDDTRPSRKATLWVLADHTTKAEAQHSLLIGKEGPTEVIDTPGALHGCGRALREAGILKPMVESFVAGAENANDIRAQIAERMPSTSYGLLLQSKALKGRARLKLLRQAINANPRNEEALRQCARQHIRMGQLKDAQIVLNLMRPKVPKGLREHFLDAARAANFNQQIF